MSPIKVISQQPPGGRCTLYARYAQAIADVFDWSSHVVHSDCREAHGTGFPSLWIGDAALQPADGVILSPEDVAAHLAGIGIDIGRLAPLRAQLDIILDDLLESGAA